VVTSPNEFYELPGSTLGYFWALDADPAIYFALSLLLMVDGLSAPLPPLPISIDHSELRRGLLRVAPYDSLVT
jgi:hypothetical protein